MQFDVVFTATDDGDDVAGDSGMVAVRTVSITVLNVNRLLGGSSRPIRLHNQAANQS